MVQTNPTWDHTLCEPQNVVLSQGVLLSVSCMFVKSLAVQDIFIMQELPYKKKKDEFKSRTLIGIKYILKLCELVNSEYNYNYFLYF